MRVPAPVPPRAPRRTTLCGCDSHNLHKNLPDFLGGCAPEGGHVGRGRGGRRRDDGDGVGDRDHGGGGSGGRGRPGGGRGGNGGGGDGGGGNGSGSSGDDRSSRPRTSLDQHPPGKASARTEDIVGSEDAERRRQRERAGRCLGIGLQREDGAVLDLSRQVGTSVDSALQHTVVPGCNEVSVITEPGWVTVGEDELTIYAFELRSVPNRFVEEGGETGGEAWRARAGHDEVGVCDVRLVVLRVVVNPIPA